MRIAIELKAGTPMRALATWYAALVPMLSCAVAQPPCVAESACDPGAECLANRCVPEGGEPVPESSERVVLTPSKVAVAPLSASLPTHATLGGPTADAQLLFLDFELGALLRDARSQQLHTAFLLLPPRDNAPPLVPTTRVSVRRLATPWDVRAVGSGFWPRGTRGERRGLASGKQPIRIDVTDLLRECFEDGSRFDGFLIRGIDERPGSGFIAATGAADTVSPKLELYLLPKAPQGPALHTETSEPPR